MNVIGKYLGSSFLIVAVLVLIAHAIVPHHHHNQQVCIEKISCTLHDACTSHPEKNDHPQDDTNQNCCVLNQLVVITNNQLKQECECTVSSDKHFHKWVSLFSGNGPAEINSLEIPLNPATVPLVYSHLIPASLQLRAPPAGKYSA